MGGPSSPRFSFFGLVLVHVLMFCFFFFWGGGGGGCFGRFGVRWEREGPHLI